MLVLGRGRGDRRAGAAGRALEAAVLALLRARVGDHDAPFGSLGGVPAARPQYGRYGFLGLEVFASAVPVMYQRPSSVRETTPWSLSHSLLL